jgi:hypothetical protein
MIRFVIKAVVFSIPFILLFGTVAIVDPFHRFGYVNVTSKKVKKKISAQINMPLWKLIEYSANPSPNLIFGDSRMIGIDTNYIESINGRRYYNFSYGGSTIEEMCSTFWIAEKKIKLQSVCFGLNLNSFNISHSRNRVPGAFETATQPLMYFVNRDVIKTTYLTIQHLNSRSEVAIGKPKMSKQQFWRHILDVVTPRFYLSFKYDDRKIDEIKKIVDYCKMHQIEVFFIIPFTHIDVQSKVKELVPQSESAKFRFNLESLGPVFDFDYPNDVCLDDSKFKDPNHFTNEISKLIADEVWGKKLKFAKINF